MDKTFSGYKIMSGQDDSTLAIVWWDGTRIRSTSDSMIQKLKSHDMEIMGFMWADGEKFFQVLPYRFSNGYVYCKKVTVDDKGAEV